MKLSIEENNEQIPKFYLMYNIQTMVGLLQTILYFNLLLANLEYLTKETLGNLYDILRHPKPTK